MLKQTPKNPGTRPSLLNGGSMEKPPSDVPRLVDFGIDKKLAFRSQAIDELPQNLVREHLFPNWR
jgi:hypothetical protein